MRRLFWVAVGAATGVYVARKVQRTLDSYRPSSLAERATGLGAGLRAFAEAVREAATQRETQLRAALGLEPAAGDPLAPGEAADLLEHPTDPYAGRRSVTASEPPGAPRAGAGADADR